MTDSTYFEAAEGLDLPEERSPRYEFDAEFQQKIVALTMRDTPFAALTDGLVRPEFFENAGYAVLIKLSTDYFAKYRKAPHDKTVVSKLLANAVRDKTVPVELIRLAASVVSDLYKTNVDDRDFVADECATFARHQAVAKAILDSVDLVDRRDFDTINLKMRKALDTGVSVSTGAYDYAEMAVARTQERLDRAAGIRPPTGITTGSKTLDGYLYHQGWGRKELSVLMGAAKSGKSMAMISFSVNAIAAGHRTLYVTLEVSAGIIAERIDANIASRSMSELGTYVYDVQDKVTDFMAKSASLIVHEYPTGTMKPSSLRRLIEQYKSRGVIFDFVVVDYADLMSPERVTDNIQENSKSVYVNLRGLAMEEGFALLTATQTNREGAKKAVATATDVAEDFNKIRIADVVISINKTPEEESMGQARLFFAACRNQRSGFSVRITQNIMQAKFLTGVIGED
jgi:replicative DNA helicase